MKVYVKTVLSICKDPDCCGGEDYVDGATLSEKVANIWRNNKDLRVDEFDLTEESDYE